MQTFLGALPDDFSKWIVLGDARARSRVIFGYYIYPNFVKWLERSKLLDENDPRNVFDPPTHSFSVHDHAASTLQNIVGDPDLHTNFAAARVAMLKQTIDSLVDLEKLLNVELDKAIKIAG